MKMIMWFLSFTLFICSIIFIDFHMLNHPCIAGMKATWSYCMFFLMCCWILVCKCFIDNFYVYIHQGNCFIIFLSCPYLSLASE
jgi:hypothetical protein